MLAERDGGADLKVGHYKTRGTGARYEECGRLGFGGGLCAWFGH
jgi:hypothetical protein